MGRKEELLKLIDSIVGRPVLVIGDLMLDRYIWGKVDRISPEAPVPIVHEVKTEDRLGGAGNVVRNLCNLGAKVSVCGLVGDDIQGKTVLSLLEQTGIARDGLMIDRDRPTCFKTRVIAHQQQVVRIDRESSGNASKAHQEGIAAIVDAHIESSAAIVVSDYGKGAICAAVLRKLEEARSMGRIGLSVKPFVLDPHYRNFELYKGVGVVTPNRPEASAASGIAITDRESALAAAKILRAKWEAETVIVTLGEDGMLVLGSDSDESFYKDTVAREVFDVSGAGDAVTAVFASSLAAGSTPELATDLANRAAGIVVSEVGTAPVPVDRLVESIKEGDES